MTEDLDRKTASKLIGQAEKRTAIGNCQVDVAKLIKLVTKDPEAVIGNFCQGCGAIINLHKQGAREMAELIAKVKAPQSWEGFFFLSQGCVLCDLEERFRHVTLEEIAKFQS